LKVFNVILRIVLCLLIFSPILGVFGIFPAPTRDYYNTDIAFSYIDMLMAVGYVNYLMAIVFAASIVLTIMNRMALVALLILPITLNIVGFHAFLDGGLFTGGAIMGNILLLINIYFLWINRDKYKVLLSK
jgi:hypothetical protein